MVAMRAQAPPTLLLTKIYTITPSHTSHYTPLQHPPGASHAFSSTEWDWGYTSLLDLASLAVQGFLQQPGGRVTLRVVGTGLVGAQEVGTLEPLRGLWARHRPNHLPGVRYGGGFPTQIALPST